MAQKPSIPKGTRDFSPIEVAKRSYIMNTIRDCFQKFGFQPIETPSFENSSTLMGKYGEEGDRLIFKILDSGEYLEKANKKISKLDRETIEHVSSLFNELLQNIRNSLDSQCLNNLNANKRIENVEIIKLFILTFITDLVWNSKDIAYVNWLEEAFNSFFKKYATQIAISIVNRENFFNNDVAFDNFLLVEKKEILKEFYKYIEELGISFLRSSYASTQISEKALRYDLTVPFARYVVQYQNDIVFPFKRYQMQPVWRADRPQKGRFREFYQCDADVVGSKSLWQEAEFVQLYDQVFTKLGLEGVTIKMNNRKILSGIAEVIGASDRLIDFTVALDKLDKIGEDGVVKEMLAKGISQDAITKVAPLFTLSGSFAEQLAVLEKLLVNSETGSQGINELQFIQKAIDSLGLQTATLQLDVTLARGLNYYTGAIFEVAAPEGVKMGSIGGGGRYDDLTGIFGLKDISGVGISFGLDRIYLVLEELNLFPETTTQGVQVLFINFGETEALYAMQAIKRLRESGITTELYPDTAKMKKQMTYANRRDIPYVVLAGNQEMSDKTYTLKNMEAGTQETVDLNQLIARVTKE